MKPSLLSGLALLAALLVTGTVGLRASDSDSEIPALVAKPTGVRHPGSFVWADLVTTDRAGAVDFYTKLFGWTLRQVGRRADAYTLLLNAGRPVAGIVYRRPAPESKETKGSRWIGLIAVTNINESVNAVTSAGGRLLIAPHKVGARGMQALVADSEGSPFGLISSPSGDPRPEDTGGPGSWIWVQLFSGKPADTGAFYHRALGYEVAEDTRTPRTDDFVLSTGGVARAGLTPLPEGHGGRPGWLGYVHVANMEATIAGVQELGGRVLVPPQAARDSMQVAIIADPFGGAIGLVSPPAATEGTK